MALEVLSRLRLPAAPTAPIDVTRLMDLTTGGINYSTVARDTGLKWIESSPVWRIVYMGNTGAGLGTANTIGQLANFVGLVNVIGYCVGVDHWRYPVGYAAAGDYLSVRVFEDGTVSEIHSPAFFSNAPLILIVDYVTTTTDFSSWDQALTNWDAGETGWDVV